MIIKLRLFRKRSNMKNTKLPEHYWFENEYGHRVDILATVGE